GFPVNSKFQPVKNDDLLFDNLYLTATSLPGYDPLQERSLEGVALVSGFSIAKYVAQSHTH
ncbi:MAG: hypothetical protein ABFD51_14090, partial [Anaerolineaceae bacterium]